MERMITTTNQIKWSDEDVVNVRDFIPAGEYNPHNVRPWLLHDHGFTVAVVFADCLQDALDIAVDEDKMDRFLVQESDMGMFLGDYTDAEGISYLGNASEPFDIEGLGIVELDNPKADLSFAALFDNN
jgi:hypothetical protein